VDKDAAHHRRGWRPTSTVVARLGGQVDSAAVASWPSSPGSPSVTSMSTRPGWRRPRPVAARLSPAGGPGHTGVSAQPVQQPPQRVTAERSARPQRRVTVVVSEPGQQPVDAEAAVRPRRAMPPVRADPGLRSRVRAESPPRPLRTRHRRSRPSPAPRSLRPAREDHLTSRSFSSARSVMRADRPTQHCPQGLAGYTSPICCWTPAPAASPCLARCCRAARRRPAPAGTPPRRSTSTGTISR
jgi:hypothetical protein